MLKSMLEGRPLGHPLHPLLVHFPIGLFTLSLLLDLLTLFGAPSSALFDGAYYTMAAGVVMALVASLPGFADWSSIRRDHPARSAATLHMVLNLWVVTLYVANLFVRSPLLGEPRTPWFPLALSLVAMLVLSVSGWIGGALVYDDGVGVGRHRRKTRLPDRTIRVAGPGDEHGFHTIAPADQLKENETLVAEVNGHVMTIARVDGTLHAFQEYCTHRYGPLSEGTFENGSVVCPWHRSCFNVRTGEVTKNPAKVSLRTFDVETRDGTICVRVPLKQAQQN